MWLILIAKSGRRVLHSVHPTKEIAAEWSKCKEHDGEDVELVEIDGAGRELLREFLDK